MHGETIVCLATRRWNSLWRSTQQVMSRIAGRNRVLFFEPGRDPDRPVLAEMRRNWPNFFKLHMQQVQENLIVIPTPSSLPHARRYLPHLVLKATMPLVIGLNSRILLSHARWAMQQLGVEKPILWLYSPYHADLVGKLGEKLACYYNYDEHADFAPNVRIRELVRGFDDRLVRRVDLVFASSEAQWERRKALNRNSYFIPNGVDFEMFNRALAPDLVPPHDISSIPRPIIGYVGWLGFQIDLQLLRRLAETCSDCSLVFVGPDAMPNTQDKQALQALHNVYFLGRKERCDLAGYLKVFDVALIPYLLSGHGTSLYPLKIHEYLAAGRTVVSSALPSLQPLNHVVRLAETHDEFVHHVREALQEDTSQAVEARVAVARENTWDQRVEEIYQILAHRLNGTRSNLDQVRQGSF